MYHLSCTGDLSSVLQRPLRSAERRPHVYKPYILYPTVPEKATSKNAERLLTQLAIRKLFAAPGRSPTILETIGRKVGFGDKVERRTCSAALEVPYLEVICFGLAIQNGAHGAAQCQLPAVLRSSNFDEHRESSAASLYYIALGSWPPKGFEPNFDLTQGLFPGTYIIHWASQKWSSGDILQKPSAAGSILSSKSGCVKWVVFYLYSHQEGGGSVQGAQYR
ncbi:hypothetical protein DFH08DRAFT_826381 [Mycena albidolilacea]|uniref:Uncharacterized protein n=1 Tax=Mycena albidolilacea TaxID=1033008 RepID=A0AAD7E8D5_9AGAR|nr:hypothetical protein DFH08DRAFT_826381 [Mycena albidolilacea]